MNTTPLTAIKNSVAALQTPAYVESIRAWDYLDKPYGKIRRFDDRLDQVDEEPTNVYVITANKAFGLYNTLLSLSEGDAAVSPIVINGPKHDLGNHAVDPTDDIAELFGVTDLIDTDTTHPVDRLCDAYATMTADMARRSSSGHILVTDAETVLPRTWAANWSAFLAEHADVSVIGSGQVVFEDEDIPHRRATNLLRNLGSSTMMGVREFSEDMPKTIFQMNMAIAPSPDARQSLLSQLAETAQASTHTLQNDFELREAAVSAGAVEVTNWSNPVYTDGYRFRNPLDVLKVIAKPEHRLALHNQQFMGSMFSETPRQ